eukprot:5558057-Amphidinium_carterae.1
MYVETFRGQLFSAVVAPADKVDLVIQVKRGDLNPVNNLVEDSDAPGDQPRRTGVESVWGLNPGFGGAHKMYVLLKNEYSWLGSCSATM